MQEKPSPSQYRRCWITLLPPQFKDQYTLLMDDLPPHWRDIDEITDLAEATQIEIDTRKLTFQKTKIMKKSKKHNYNLPDASPPSRQHQPHCSPLPNLCSSRRR